MTEKVSATMLMGHMGQKQDRMARTRKSLGLEPSVPASVTVLGWRVSEGRGEPAATEPDRLP